MSSTWPTTPDNFVTSHQDGVQETIHAVTDNKFADAVNKMQTVMSAGMWMCRFDRAGTLTVLAGVQKDPQFVTAKIVAVRIAVNTAPTGASIICDFNKNGTTIFTTQANRPTIAIGAFSALAGAAQVTAVAPGDLLSMDVDQIGSTIAGADLRGVVLLAPA